jgi:hypothetical protein
MSENLFYATSESRDIDAAPFGFAPFDYAFARNETYWTRIELTDGNLVEGIFDSNSLASSEYDDRDIFIESVFQFNDGRGEYEQLERNAGVLVRGDAIKTITFFSQADNQNEQPIMDTDVPQEQNFADTEGTLENPTENS